jgi:hypothetical protein
MATWGLFMSIKWIFKAFTCHSRNYFWHKRTLQFTSDMLQQKLQPSQVHSQLGYQKGVFKFLKTVKDNFGFLFFIIHYYCCNGLMYDVLLIF